MKITEHADHTEKLYGLRSEDIHKWMDGYFDRQSFEHFLQHGREPGWDPYKHRKFRHCREAFPEVLKEFSYKYNEQQITRVFECHIRDDYDGYIPSREDFTNGTFKEKYHESEDKTEAILTPGELTRYFRGLYYKRKRSDKSLISRFGIRIIVPAAISLILFVISVFIFILPLFHDSLMSEKEDGLKEISSVAVSILDYYSSLEEDGALSRQSAQDSAVKEIQKLRYGPLNDNYFWITDMQPVMIMHPWRPDLVGLDLTEYRDNMNRSGKNLFIESVELVRRQGGGFLKYLWQLDEEGSRVVPKLSYVQGVGHWGWIIGTGIYVHDVEEEIARLTNKLIIILLIITALMVLLVLYMVTASLKIEHNRQQAESGLVEAKERYRALVEASNEGYILMMSHRNVFSNPTFQRMTGYSEDDLLADDFWENLFPEDRANERVKTHLENLKQENPVSDEFETAIRCRSGIRLDVIVRISRIFLSEENGQVISFRVLMNKSFTLPLFMDSVSLDDPVLLLEQLRNSESAAHTVRLLNELPVSVRSMVLGDIEAHEIRVFISDAYSEGLKSIAAHSIKEAGTPPAEMAFLSFGSSGRRELTLFSDQDNAIVFRTSSEGEALEKIRLYFLNLSDRVCSLLNQAGFPFCPGGIMAVNPAYCLSLEEWKQQYRSWFNQADSLSLLDIHVFFDISCGFGDSSAAVELQAYIFELCRNRPEFLVHFARNCLNYKPQLGLLGTVKTERRDGFQVINIKESLIPLINAARIYALKEELTCSSTLSRIEELVRREVLSKETGNEMKETFEILWRLRLSNQILSHGELRKVNDDLDPAGLSDENRRELQKALSVISGIQSRLSYDFLGMDLS
ncbi:MAG: cache domain-containing protein [Spirochaetales bacterium]|nr:cache domain-containing protein [Spirochaetales bacterium]